MVTLTSAEVCPCNSHGTCTFTCPGETKIMWAGALIFAEGTSKLTIAKSRFKGRTAVDAESVTSLRLAPNMLMYDPGATALAPSKLAALVMPFAKMDGATRAKPTKSHDRPSAFTEISYLPGCDPRIGD